VSILAAGASDLIYPWILMMQNKLKITSIKNTIVPYPSLHEINKDLLAGYYAQQKENDFMERFMQVIYHPLQNKFQKTVRFFKKS